MQAIFIPLFSALKFTYKWSLEGNNAGLVI